MFDADTGKQLWRKDELLDLYHGTQSTLVTNGKVYLVTSTAIEAFDAKTGERLWQASMDEKLPSLTASDKLVIVASGDAGKAVALSDLDGSRLWESPIPRSNDPQFESDRLAFPAIVNGVVYIAAWGRLERVTGE